MAADVLEHEIVRNQAQLELAERELSHWQSQVNQLRKQLERKSTMLAELRRV